MTSIPISDIPGSKQPSPPPQRRWWQLGGANLHQLGAGQAQAMIANET